MMYVIKKGKFQNFVGGDGKDDCLLLNVRLLVVVGPRALSCAPHAHAYN